MGRLLTENRIFMKFSPAYDNENISQCANIILRHDQWVDQVFQISTHLFTQEPQDKNELAAVTSKISEVIGKSKMLCK